MTMTTQSPPTNTQLAEQIAPAKPGPQTSEFWLTLVAAVIGILVSLHVIGPDFAKQHEGLVPALALLGSVLAPGLYALSRGIVKHAQTQAAAAVLNTKLNNAAAYGTPVATALEEVPGTRKRTKRSSSSGFALLGLIGAILLVIGAIWLIVGLAHHHFDVFACIVAAVGAILLYFDGGWGSRTSRL